MRAMAFAVVGAFLVACGGAVTPPPVSPPAAATARSSPAPTSGTTAAAPTQAARPAFLSTRLTDVRTGEQFTLGGFQGKVVLGIAMAVW